MPQRNTCLRKTTPALTSASMPLQWSRDGIKKSAIVHAQRQIISHGQSTITLHRWPCVVYNLCCLNAESSSTCLRTHAWRQVPAEMLHGTPAESLPLQPTGIKPQTISYIKAAESIARLPWCDGEKQKRPWWCGGREGKCSQQHPCLSAMQLDNSKEGFAEKKKKPLARSLRSALLFSFSFWWHRDQIENWKLETVNQTIHLSTNTTREPLSHRSVVQEFYVWIKKS